MKTLAKLLLALFLVILLPIGCSESGDEPEILCGTYNGNQLYRGPRGGCYYWNSNNNKTYVDRSYCTCL